MQKGARSVVSTRPDAKSPTPHDIHRPFSEIRSRLHETDDAIGISVIEVR